MQTFRTFLACLGFVAASGFGQVTTGRILGVVLDPSGATVGDAAVAVRSLETNATQKSSSDEDGRFLIPQLPVGSYEVTIQKAGFATYVQGPIVLRLNQDADLRVRLELAGSVEKIVVREDAPLINTTDAEVGINFDSKRIAELPMATNRNVYSLSLSAAGVSQLQTGQGSNVLGGGSAPLAVNGMRVRSNNFMVDGQDNNVATNTGESMPINNPDVLSEFRLVTNQFTAQYGGAAGSIVNVITKSGTNQFHGSAFWFHNDNHLNSRSNLDKQQLSASPFRTENQFGGTVGGPVIHDKTFFFLSGQRWTDRRLGSGVTIRGVPTAEGLSLLRSIAGSRPTVQALLDFLPPAQQAIPGLSSPVVLGGNRFDIPLGILTGSSNISFNDWQWSGRVDHRLSDRHSLGFRYLGDDQVNSGDGQVTPPGLSQVTSRSAQSFSTFLTSSFSARLFNELRLSYGRLANQSDGLDPRSKQIPSLEINELGLRTATSSPTRTALGLAFNLPTISLLNNYQLQDTVSLVHGPHVLKFGLDFRNLRLSSYTFREIRGRMVYTTLRDFVDDTANSGSISSPLPGGQASSHYDYRDYFAFFQDQWRIRPRLSLTLGLRYESPGSPFPDFAVLNRRILNAAGGDPRYDYGRMPPRDTNNFAPRFGFNYRVKRFPGFLGRLTGDDRSVIRGGYARTYDFTPTNISSQIGTSFPFVKSSILTRGTPNSLATLRSLPAAPISGDPNLLFSRIVMAPDFRSPFAEQVALQFERQLSANVALTVGYVGTKGTGLFEIVDANPAVPGTGGQRRVDPTHNAISLRCNCGSSTYHSLQTSVEKRLSKHVAMAAHYTWSSFIDSSSDGNVPVGGEINMAQDSFNRRAERGRSAFDRPHRFVANGVWELPSPAGKFGRTLLSGWQVSGFLTLQSGAPFEALDGADPGGRLTMIRANVNTNLDLARMSVSQILQAGGASLFRRVTAAEGLGNIGRNVLRSSGIKNVDFGLVKNTRISESVRMQLRAEFYNLANTRNFGIPDNRVSSTNFLNQWGTDGGNRRIVMALRLVF
jgi:hypothetical protein